MVRRSKFGNRRTPYGGFVFDSAKEAERFMVLEDMRERSEITDLVVQPRYVLQEGFRDQTGRWHRAIEYRGDFEYREAGALVVEDVKGVATPVFRLKEKLFRRRYPQIDFRIVRL